MKEEQRERVVFRDFVPEEEQYTSRGLTKEEFIIRRYEEATGNKFDPETYEIVEENNAFDDGYDNPLSTYVVIRKKSIIIGDPPITPIPPRGPGENDGPGVGEPGGTRGPGGTRQPGGPRGPIISGFPGGTREPEKPTRPEPPRGPENDDGPEVEQPGGKGPGEPQEPEKPTKPEPPRGPEKPVPTPQVPEHIRKDPTPKKPVPTPQVPEEVTKKPGQEEPPRKPEDNPPVPPKEPEKTPKEPTEPENTPKPPEKPTEGKPPVLPPLGPVPTPQVPRTPKEQTPEEIEKQRLVQDMLDKYYGNKEKRKEYKERYKRFKSHIIQKAFQYVNKQGVLTSGSFYTVDTNYPEYEEDAQFLQLKEYAARLERLSKSEVGDDSAYISVVNDYLHRKAAIGERVEETFEELVEILKDDDKEYLLTNNYAYNTHMATRENLSTLGKHGENVPYIPMSKEKTVKQKVLNIVRRGINVVIFLRDHVSAPIHRGIGKFIAKPIHELIFDIDNQPSGLYRGKRTHRYVARKEYFENKYLEELAIENEQRVAEGKPEKKIRGIWMTFSARFKAIFNYEEGNIAILNAGAYDIERSYDEIKEEKRQILQRKGALQQELQQLMTEINELQARLQNNNGARYTAQERAVDSVRLDTLIARVIKLQEEDSLLLVKGRDIIQTDAISLSTHDMANKENMTKVVTGVKTAVRIGAMKLIGPSIKKLIKDTVTRPETEVVETQLPGTTKTIPGHYEDQLVETTKPRIKNVTISELTEGDSTTVTRHALGGTTKTVTGNDHIRGIYFNSGRLSAGDTKYGIDGTVLVKLERTVSPDEKAFDLFAELSNQIRGTHYASGQEVIDQIQAAADPAAELEKIVGKTALWTSTRTTGTPTGWVEITDTLLDKAIESDVVTEVVPVFIPEQVIEIPGEVLTTEITKYITSDTFRQVIDWRYAVISGLLLAGGANDLNDLLRRTRSKEEVVGEIQKDFPTREQKRPKRSNVPYHQRNNKAKQGKRHTNWNKYNFKGNRRGDYASTYNEAGKGTPGDYTEGRSRGR